MDRASMLPALNLFTLVAVFLAIVIAFAVYWSKRSNRAPKDGGPPTEDGSV
ncbi:hypothetical protein [Sandarakinorhabdus sp. DWP1-3-1]|uniref:hypothetical protein n=1 Tax=Sandarakinorhabdus sp. DWP1-3-1 TaxID=2804627 RepID=UPI0026A7644D